MKILVADKIYIQPYGCSQVTVTYPTHTDLCHVYATFMHKSKTCVQVRMERMAQGYFGKGNETIKVSWEDAERKK